MNKDELLELYNEVKDLLHTPNERWRRAFDLYNSENGTGLGMGCIACYTKVLNHIIGLLNKQEESIEYRHFMQRPNKQIFNRHTFKR